jgi:hypothetical protein
VEIARDSGRDGRLSKHLAGGGEGEQQGCEVAGSWDFHFFGGLIETTKAMGGRIWVGILQVRSLSDGPVRDQRDPAGVVPRLGEQAAVRANTAPCGRQETGSNAGREPWL